MQITQEEYGLLQKLVADIGVPILDPQKHVTAKMLSDQTGLGTRRCLDILNEKMDNGELQREKVRLPNGVACYGFYEA